MKTRAAGLMVLAVVLAALGRMGCDHWSSSNAITVGETIRLTSGPHWTLEAQAERNRYLSGLQTRLCLKLMVDGTQTAGGREFDLKTSFGYYDMGPGPSTFVLGPVSPNAVTVRISFAGLPDRNVPTSPLPAMKGIPSGRFFVAEVDPDGKIAEANPPPPHRSPPVRAAESPTPNG